MTANDHKERPSRQPLTESPTLRDWQWTLLPGAPVEASGLEPTLRWQEEVGPEFWGTREVVVYWRPDPSNLIWIEETVASLAVQSIPTFRVVVDAPESFCESVLMSIFDKNGLSGRVDWVDDREEVFTVGDDSWLFFLAPNNVLHPTALFTLLKETVTNLADLFGFFETLSDESTGGPHAVRFHSGAEKLSVFGRSGMSSSFWIRGSLWNKMVQQKSLLSTGASWRAAITALATGSRIERTPLALTVLPCARGEPVAQSVEEPEESLRDALIAYGEGSGIHLSDWRYDPSLGSGIPTPPSSDERIAAIVPFRDQEELTSATFRSLAGQANASRIRLVAVDNGSNPAIAQRLRTLADSLFVDQGVLWLQEEGSFNFARLNNLALARIDEPHLLFLNNDVEFTGPDDLARLQGFLEWAGVGMVGGALHYPDGNLQAAGIRFGALGPEVVRHPDHLPLVFREVDALTFACALVRRSVFEEVGRLDEVLCPNGFGDALLGGRFRESDWRILIDPTVRVIHHESPSRGSRPEEMERMELSREGVPIYSYGPEFVRSGVDVVHRFGRSRPSLGKRIYRAVKAFRKELMQ
ncbi:MAG: glycosyltransferase [Verrucomicrobiota bacterium]